MIILGIGGILSDAACALLKDGKLVAAIEEKKIARGHTPGKLPVQAIEECLRLAGVSADQVDCVALVRPFSEGLETELHLELRGQFAKSRLVVVEHHAAHAASAFYASPFESATVLTLDRVGDFRCGARWSGKGTELTLEEDLYYPDSLGDIYGRVTELLGFKPNADEHKVQWLSTAGDGRFIPLFEEIMSLNGASWPRIDRSFFDGDRVSGGAFSRKLYDRLGLEDAAPLPETLRPHVAAGLQRAMERAVIRMAGPAGPLCFAGGLGMNALLIAALEADREVFVQPASGNAGTALGAVLHS
ncbi:MAG TPA: carbamoyltransferase N-terminal domain-containing protein, partial [Bryobacteraceae bacterium]|nr:carbamoyltransferase N-terminal domain-containing protein [Bryobacteraceae bacterium]